MPRRLDAGSSRKATCTPNQKPPCILAARAFEVYLAATPDASTSVSPFQIYKFRTMRSPFDCLGAALPEKRRLSAIANLLSKTGLDELPQLLNVLVGEMSLVGPRPLVPEDQPADPTIRLMVGPGITGWAQVNWRRTGNEQKRVISTNGMSATRRHGWTFASSVSQLQRKIGGR
jgi:Bacterial sugar transferase